MNYSKDLIEASQFFNETQNKINNNNDNDNNNNINNANDIKIEIKSVNNDNNNLLYQGKKEENNPLDNAVDFDLENNNDNNNEILISNHYPIFDDEVNKEINSPFNDKDNKPPKDKIPANPPKEIQNEVQSSENKFIQKEEEKDEDFYNGHTLNKSDFQELTKDGLKDKRSLKRMFISIVLNNSTIYYVLFDKLKEYESIFIRVSLLIIPLNLYLFINTMLLTNKKMVFLYSSYYKSGNLCLILFLSFLMSPIIIAIKKYLTIKEFLYELVVENEKYRKERGITEEEAKRRMLDKINEYNKYNRGKYRDINIYGGCGLAFLIFNCILLTSYCGIYENSVGRLILNICMSILLSSIIYILFYLIGAVLRHKSLNKFNSEILYNISRFFNPLYLSLEDILKMKGSFLNICNEKNEEENKENNLREFPSEEYKK